MGISFLKSIIFFIIILFFAYLLTPTARNLGRVYFKSKEVEKSLSYLKQQFKHNPGDIYNSLRYLKALSYTDDRPTFKKVAEKLIKENPYNIALLKIIAQFYEDNLEYSQSAFYWRKIAFLKPDEEEVVHKLISYYRLWGDNEKLKELLQMRLRKKIFLEDEVKMLARLYLKLGDTKDAEKLYKYIFRRYPSDTVLIRLAEIYEYRKEYKKVLKVYKKLSENNPQNSDYALTFLDKLVSFKRTSQLTYYMNKFLKRFFHNDEIVLFIAQQYASMQKYKTALKLFKELYRRNKNMPELLLKIAEIDYLQGNFLESSKNLLAFNKTTGGTFRSYYLLGDVLDSLGDVKGAKERYKKALSLLEKKKVKDISQEIDEAWLLYKLGRRKKLETRIAYLLNKKETKTYPALLHLAALIFLDKKDLKRARQIIIALEKAHIEEKTLLEVKLSYYRAGGDFYKAEKFAKKLVSLYPQSLDYALSYAEVLVDLKKYPIAEKLYRDIIKRGKRNQDILRTWRSIYTLLKNNSSFQFIHRTLPQSLRHNLLSQGGQFWLNSNTRFTFNLKEEFYTQKAQAAVASLRKRINTATFKIEKKSSPLFTLAGQITSSNMEGENFWEEKLSLTREGILSAKLFYTYNHLIRDPIEGLNLQGRLNEVGLENRLTLRDNLYLNNSFNLKWYRIKKSANTINGKPSLGKKYTNDISLEYILLDKPFIALNFHYFVSHWEKSFSGAENLIDFIGDEAVYEGGFYCEKFLGSRGKIFATLTRKFDKKRNFYATLSSFGWEYYLNDKIKLSLNYEYSYEDNATTGAGNSQTIYGGIKIYF